MNDGILLTLSERTFQDYLNAKYFLTQLSKSEEQFNTALENLKKKNPETLWVDTHPNYFKELVDYLKSLME